MRGKDGIKKAESDTNAHKPCRENTILTQTPFSTGRVVKHWDRQFIELVKSPYSKSD